MSVTSGFFNSFNHDRRYNAEQMSAIFDGIINDGVFANIGTAFAVQADEGDNISVGIGRAWFNSTWLLNDAILILTDDVSEILLDRYDAVVIEIDHSDSVRAGTIKIVKGSASSSPQFPTLLHTTDVNQYPLAYIFRKAGSMEITQADITNMVGTSSCPYITGILEVVNVDNIVAQWEAQWKQWYSNITTNGSEDFTSWMGENAAMFATWFAGLQMILSGDEAANLLLLMQAHGICDTDTGTAEKAVTSIGFSLVEGATIRIKFSADEEPIGNEEELEDSNGNAILDADGHTIIGVLDFGKIAENPTLNVSGTRAYPLLHRGSPVRGLSLCNGRIYSVLFDGYAYEIVGDIGMTGGYQRDVPIVLPADGVYQILLEDSSESECCGLYIYHTATGKLTAIHEASGVSIIGEGLTLKVTSSRKPSLHYARI